MAPKAKILIIEDNEAIRENTSEILEFAGFEVFQSNNGKLGVELANAHQPHLILCDIMMPYLDGFGVLELIQKNPLTSNIPFVFLTAKTERNDLRKAMEMGADDYLTKPFNDAELLNAIETRLRKKELQELVLSHSFKQMEALFSSRSGLQELRELGKSRKTKQVKRKQIIYYDGDEVTGIYLILAGNVKTFKVAEDGREFLTGVYGADEYFGIASMLSGEEYQESAEAVDDVTLCLLPRSMMEELINRYPDVAESFIKLLANNVLNKEEQLLQLAYHSVRKRMAKLLLRLREKAGKDDLGSLIFSREDLAAMAGIATETVSRILTDFRDEGLIAKIGSQILIQDATRLANMKN